MSVSSGIADPVPPTDLPPRPEFDANDAAADDVAEAIHRDGLALIRGAFPTDRVDDLRRCAVDHFNGLDRRIRDGESDQEIECFQKYNNVSIMSVCEGGQPNMLDLFPMMENSVLPHCLAAYLQSNVVGLVQHCLVRRVYPNRRYEAAPFHQDAGVIGIDVPLTCWIPLNDCGETAPSLELVARPLDSLLELNSRPKSGHPGTEIDEESVFERYGQFLWHPRYLAGDVIVFNNYTIHRSYLTEQMSQARYSVEFRCVPQSQIPDRFEGTPAWCPREYDR